MPLTFHRPIVKLVAKPQFIGIPDDLWPLKEATKECHEAGMGPKGSLGLIAASRTRACDLIWKADQNQGTDAERIIECAGRTCYDSYGKGRKSADYHKHIMEVDHGSVTEHVQFTFFLGNLSRGLTHELVRHRVGIAISQRSTRYVDEDGSEWVLHPLIGKYINDFDEGHADAASGQYRAEMEDVITKAMTASRDAYRFIADHLEKWAVSQGVDKFTARKQARGAARGLLGNALLTEMIWSCNIRTMRGTILRQRANGAADAEIRALGIALYEIVLPLAPLYFEDFERRPAADGLADELYLPNSPAELLKVERQKNAALEARVKELESRLVDGSIGERGNGG